MIFTYTCTSLANAVSVGGPSHGPLQAAAPMKPGSLPLTAAGTILHGPILSVNEVLSNTIRTTRGNMTKCNRQYE